MDKSTQIMAKIYEDRNHVALLAAELARMCGYKVTVSVDPDEPDWPVLYIELPTGQISWHMQKNKITNCLERFPHKKTNWDGHTTRQKNKRIREFLSLPLSK